MLGLGCLLIVNDILHFMGNLPHEFETRPHCAAAGVEV